MLGRDTLVLCWSPYDLPVLLWSGIYSGSCTGTQEMNVSPSSLSLGGILEGYSDSPRVISKASKVKGEELDIK